MEAVNTSEEKYGPTRSLVSSQQIDLVDEENDQPVGNTAFAMCRLTTFVQIGNSEESEVSLADQ